MAENPEPRPQQQPQQRPEQPRQEQQRPQQPQQQQRPPNPQKEKLTSEASTAFTETHFSILKSFLLWIIAGVIVPYTVTDKIASATNLPVSSTDNTGKLNVITNGILMTALAFILRGTKSLTKKDIALFIPIIPTMLAIRAAQNDQEIRSSDLNEPKTWKPVFTAIVSVLSVFGAAMLIYHFHYVLKLTETEKKEIEFLSTKIPLGKAKFIQYLIPIVIMALWNGLSYGIVPRPYSLATLFLTLLTVFNVDTYISKFVAGMTWAGLLQAIIP